MIAIVDYDAGNIKSVENAFRALGGDAVLSRDPALIETAEKVVLPGVGVFGDAVEKLKSFGLEKTIHSVIESGRPFLAICVGLQLLFDGSEESPEAEGLKVFPGKIKRIPAAGGLKVPQIGWNSLHLERESRLLHGLDEGSYVYFVHSYYLESEDPQLVTASTEYGVHIHAAVEKDNVFATQFHPEKSSRVGLRILKNFMEL
ncbi:MAG: imidazole glycerol phosphate synthase subunit HisH [Lachnospiraceae bacterium]|nr:imidazole glycerol phosphate synthase subunit HisH [Lachnospiraceae bacterium]